uniref:Uncharacterized protein n=1 Tax=Arundo donax TaxID=35708 RepID=A0A0A9AQC0_ARUDO
MASCQRCTLVWNSESGNPLHLLLDLVLWRDPAATGRRPSLKRDVDPVRPRLSNWDDVPGSWNVASTLIQTPVTMCLTTVQYRPETELRRLLQREMLT